MNTDLPLYKCHKVVRAGIIHGSTRAAWSNVLTVNVPGAKAMIEVTVPDGWCKKHDVQHGGYYVEYQDGYQSYSPADVFEAGYKLVQEAEQLTKDDASVACSNACGITADNLPAFDYVGEAKRHTLSQILIGRSFGGSTLTDIANEITKAFDALEGKPMPHASQTDYAEFQELIDNLQNLGTRFRCPAGMQRFAWLRSELEELEKRRADDCPDLEAADFSDALMWLKDGKRVARSGWNGAGQWVELFKMEGLVLSFDHNDDKYPIAQNFVLKNAQGVAVPGWTPSTGDLMATDWYVVE